MRAPFAGCMELPGHNNVQANACGGDEVKWAVIVAGVLVAAVFLAQWFLARGFRDGITQLENLTRDVARPAPPSQDALPEILRAYATRAGGRVGGPAHATEIQRAELRLGESEVFTPVEGRHLSSNVSAQFVWTATGRMNGFIPFRVVDAYVAGEGRLEARLLDAVPVARIGGPDGARGEMMRYLSELPLMPDAILNVPDIRWRQTASDTVEATVATPGGDATVRFLFDPQGDIVGLQADDRPRMSGGAAIPTPWIGSFGRYRQFGRYRIPSYGEVGWLIDGELFTYWRGEIVDYVTE